MTKPQHTQNEYTTDGAELAAIYRIGCKMTCPLEQLAKDISVLDASVDEEFQKLHTRQRSVESMYDEVQTTN